MNKVVMIEWVDSSRKGTTVWEELPPPEGNGLCVCKSLGFVTHEDKHSITIAAHVDLVSKHMSEHLTIPKAAIIKRRRVAIP